MSITIFNQNHKQSDQNQNKTQKRLHPQPKAKQSDNNMSKQKQSPESQFPKTADKSSQKNNKTRAKKTKKQQTKTKREKTIGRGKKPLKLEVPPSVKSKKRREKLFSSYLVKPKNVRYSDQIKEEDIVLLLRQHPITQLGKAVLGVLGFFFPILLFASRWIEMVDFKFQIGILLAWYLILFGFILESFLAWYFQVFIITNRRVIDIEFRSMIYKDITSTKLESIQDLNFITTGVLASLIDYGTVYIQAAGEQAKTDFKKVPHPAEVVKTVNELIAQKRKNLGRGYQL